MKREESTSMPVSNDLRLIGSTLKIVFTLQVVSVQYAQDLLRWVCIMFAGNADAWLMYKIMFDFCTIIVKKTEILFFHIFSIS
ncbi:hypothetical protein BAC3_00919 [uncultured bacterium]|nr:hypothetical protein BAC3_00919 [uncultured bacterium]